MADFEKAIDTVLNHEGGYVNNPNDPGGATKFGLSQRYLQDHPEFDRNGDGCVSADEVKSITKIEAKAEYKKNWWNAYGYDRIRSDAVATKLFDMCINMGQSTGVKLMQKACNKALFPKSIYEDGVMGAMTVNAINACKEDDLLMKFRWQCRLHYQKLIEKNPRLAEFAAGWEKRAES